MSATDSGDKSRKPHCFTEVLVARAHARFADPCRVPARAIRDQTRVAAGVHDQARAGSRADVAPRALARSARGDVRAPAVATERAVGCVERPSLRCGGSARDDLAGRRRRVAVAVAGEEIRVPVQHAGHRVERGQPEQQPSVNRRPATAPSC